MVSVGGYFLDNYIFLLYSLNSLIKGIKTMKREWKVIDDVAAGAEETLNKLAEEVKDLRLEGFQVETKPHHLYYHLVVSYDAPEKSIGSEIIDSYFEKAIPSSPGGPKPQGVPITPPAGSKVADQLGKVVKSLGKGTW